MALFQKSVLNKYLKNQSSENIDKAFEKFSAYFHNHEIQNNIREAKEEQFQEGFLRELFVNVFDYTLNPQPNYNLTSEFKNQTGSKKADGAILKEGKAIGVIELKGTDTKDLEKINNQAFNYKNNHAECIYVITSNFEKLRFFIHNAVEHLEFNLFTLTKEQFTLLYFCLYSDNIFSEQALKAKQESVVAEENITKKLYKDYATFKNELWQNLCTNNPKLDKLLLFKKTQKLLDRFLFVLFAEDSGLLPPNSIRRMIDRYHVLKKEDAYKPLYEIFKQYFGYLNIGRKGQNPQDDIFAYNGGLFFTDELLDNITISDDVLLPHITKISAYDFQSEVDVNILGHIFENSLNDIEAVTAQLEGQEIEKSKTKRKKDGVFYTPKYITKYIVENTVGKLCDEKKQELGIVDEEYAKGRRNRKKETIKLLDDALQQYRNWLLNITICDPACGSGAFLNQALEFLINEHNYIAELEGQLHSKVFGDYRQGALGEGVENHILENNLFGVDINEESVEIAKLSLWLRTAQRGRKLTTLNNNIKCGNSLIDDPAVAGNKAFNWHKEFPQVFNPSLRETKQSNGFDVVIGNPPYVRADLLGQYQEYLKQNYSVHNTSGDLFSYFYEKSFKLLKHEKGVFGFISNTFDKTTAGVNLREYLQSEISILKYIDFTEVQIFEGATTYPVIIIAQNTQKDNNTFQYIKIPKASQSPVIDIELHNVVKVEQNSLEKLNWSFKNNSAVSLIEKLKANKNIKEIYGKCYYGVKTALNEAFIIPKRHEVGDHIKPIYEGKELAKWVSPESVQQLIIFESKWTKKNYGSDINEEEGINKLKIDYPELINHLLSFEEQAKKRYDKGDFFWELRNCAYYDLFEKPKIVFPNLQNSNKFAYDESGAYINAPAVILPTNDKFLVAILNSKIVWYFLTNICVVRSGGYIEVKPQYFEQIPIPEITNKSALTNYAEVMISKIAEKHKIKATFIALLKSKFLIEKLTKKLENWHELEFKEFLKELKKAKVQLTLSQEAEWMHYFNEQKQKAQTLKSEIDKTDKEIDNMVYQLYELTEEEIEIVEGK